MAPNRRPPTITCTATIVVCAQPRQRSTAAVWHRPPFPARPIRAERRNMALAQDIMEGNLAQHYDVTILTVRPGTHPRALEVLGSSLGNDTNLLACWYSDIGAVNQILIIRK